ncbi:MAG TPA: DUF3037 domain-containing protein [Flavobacteriales bacterium]
MQEKHLYEYAVIRLVPRVEREEFINVGVILYCASQKFLDARIYLPKEKLACFDCSMKEAEIMQFLETFIAISKGGKTAGPIGLLPVAERFRWLTASRSTIIQCSIVHNGLTTNPTQTLEHLFKTLVLPADK